MGPTSPRPQVVALKRLAALCFSQGHGQRISSRKVGFVHRRGAHPPTDETIRSADVGVAGNDNTRTAVPPLPWPARSGCLALAGSLVKRDSCQVSSFISPT